MASSSEEKETPRSAPRKRATRQRATRSSVRATREKAAAAKRRAPKKAESTPEPEKKTAESPERKAPTPIASSKVAKKRKRNRMIVVGVLIVVGIGASAAVGSTDKGAINVDKAIRDRNERIQKNQPNQDDLMVESIRLPKQTNNVKKNEPDKATKNENSTSTATSTDATATSTDAVATSTEEVTTGGESTDETLEPEPADTETATTTL